MRKSLVKACGRAKRGAAAESRNAGGKKGRQVYREAETQRKARLSAGNEALLLFDFFCEKAAEKAVFVKEAPLRIDAADFTGAAFSRAMPRRRCTAKMRSPAKSSVRVFPPE